MQTSANTVDVRGLTADEATADIEAALSASSALSALFIVHGVATGQLRKAVHQMLLKHPYVQHHQLEKDSAGGCTIVTLK